MIRGASIALLVCVLLPAAAAAESYLVRLDIEGYVNQPVGDAEPESKTLLRIQAVPDRRGRFDKTIVVGAQSLRIRGSLRRAGKSELQLSSTTVLEVDTGQVIAAADGRQKPVVNTTKNSTTITLKPGGKCTVAGFRSESRPEGKPALQTKQDFSWTLIRLQECGD